MWTLPLLLLSLPAADSLKGTVLALASGHPLAGVVVEVGAQQATTDSAGHFALAGSASHLRLTWHGASGTGLIPSGQAGEPLRVVVDTETPELYPTIEHDDWHLAGRWGMPGFFERAREGYGTFFTRNDLTRTGYANLQDVLKSFGIGHGCLRNGGGCGALIMYRNNATLVSIYVDGEFQRNEQAYDLPLGDVTGIEYYPPPNPPRPALTSSRAWIAKTDYLNKLPLEEFTVVVWTRNFYQRLAER